MRNERNIEQLRHAVSHVGLPLQCFPAFPSFALATVNSMLSSDKTDCSTKVEAVLVLVVVVFNTLTAPVQEVQTAYVHR